MLCFKHGFGSQADLSASVLLWTMMLRISSAALGLFDSLFLVQATCEAQYVTHRVCHALPMAVARLKSDYTACVDASLPG